MSIFLNDLLSQITIANVTDVLLLIILCYSLYRSIKDNISIKIVFGFVLLYVIYRLAAIMKFRCLITILEQLLYKNVLVLIILFQYEIRKFLAFLGDLIPHNFRKLGVYLSWNRSSNPGIHVTSIVEAAKALGGSNTGGLIVLTNTPNLTSYIESGDLLNAVVSKRLLLAILNKESPLHDGAVLIYRNTILAARVILPITTRQDLPGQYALRHRAAIGMSEATDSLVLVISENTGQLSVAYKGKLRANLSASELRMVINNYLDQ